MGVSKTQTSDPKNSDPLGVGLENSDPKDKTNLESECQRMLQTVLFTVRPYLNLQRK